MDQFAVHSWAKLWTAPQTDVWQVKCQFAPSKTTCAIYFYIKFSHRFVAVRLLLLMNAKSNRKFGGGGELLGSAVKILNYLWPDQKCNKLSLLSY